MKANLNKQNLHFKGYSNTISGQVVINGRHRLSYITTKLNDAGTKDLTKFRQLKENYPILDNNMLPDSDSFTIISVESPNLSQIAVQNKYLLSDKELTSALNNNVGGKDLEEFILKAYTFVASLTKRMSRDENFKQNSQDKIINAECLNKVQEFTGLDINSAINLINKSATFSTYPKIAQTVNSLVDKCFGNYF